MVNNIFSFIFGLVFGLGLIVAQMTNPAKVLAFLDVTGAWDPSLAFVMGSALLVLSGLRRWPRKSLTPPPEAVSCGTTNGQVDGKLIGGAAIFGIGWGLSGICPGPALVNLSSGLPGSYVFIGAMFLGFFLFKVLGQGKSDPGDDA